MCAASVSTKMRDDCHFHCAGESSMHVDQFRHHLRNVDPALLTVDDRLALIDLLNRCFAHHAGQSDPVDGPAA